MPWIENSPRSARLWGPRGAEARHDWTDAADAILTIDRGGFDRSLAAQALAAGAVMRTGTPVCGVEARADGVTVQTPGDHISEIALLKTQIKDGVSRFLYEQTKRRPMVFPVVVEV